MAHFFTLSSSFRFSLPPSFTRFSLAALDRSSRITLSSIPMDIVSAARARAREQRRSFAIEKVNEREYASWIT